MAIPENINLIDGLYNGYGGNIARHRDRDTVSRANVGEDIIYFGRVVMQDGEGVKLVDDTATTSAQFMGIAESKVMANNCVIPTIEGGYYIPDEMVGVATKGSYTVECIEGTPAWNAPVYVRIVDSTSNPALVRGMVGATLVAGETVLWEDVVWNSTKDAIDMAEIVLKNKVSA